ncbi:MAG: hypothetical protein ABSG43_22375 [Solirubrobacteraceae bacterium]|jgi:hypothetical protein
MALVEHANLKPWAAITGPRRAILHPDLERRNDEDPDERWVLAKSVHALRVWVADLPLDQDPDARYTDADADAYARRALRPAKPLRANGQLSDEQLAACFRVPVEKVADRRVELAAERSRPRPGRLCEDVHEPSVCELAGRARPAKRNGLLVRPKPVAGVEDVGRRVAQRRGSAPVAGGGETGVLECGSPGSEPRDDQRG